MTTGWREGLPVATLKFPICPLHSLHPSHPYNTTLQHCNQATTLLTHIPDDPTTTMNYDPSLAHLTVDDFVDVYEPAEDTYLMLDALHRERPFLTSHFSPARHPAPICVELGSGSGMIIAYLSALQRGRGMYWATDINPRANKATQGTMKHNQVIKLTLV
jgi:hypothetical protein